MMQLQWRRQGTEAGGGQNKCRMRKIPRGGMLPQEIFMSRVSKTLFTILFFDNLKATHR